MVIDKFEFIRSILDDKYKDIDITKYISKQKSKIRKAILTSKLSSERKYRLHIGDLKEDWKFCRK